MAKRITDLRIPTLFAWHQSMGVTYISAMAKNLRDRHGIQTVLFTSDPETLDVARKLYAFEAEAFAEIIDVSPVLRPTPVADLPPPAKLAELAAAADRGLPHNVTDILRTDRHIGLGFVPDIRFMRSRFTLQYSYDQSIDLVIRLLAFYRDAIRRYHPIAALVAAGCVRTSSLTALCEVEGIPTRNLVCSRLGHAAAWAVDWYNTPDRLSALYTEALREIGAGSRDWIAARLDAAIPRPFNAQIWFDTAARDRSVRYLLKRLYSTLRYVAAQRIRGRRPRSYGDYLMRDRVWLIINRWLARRRDVRAPAVMHRIPAGTPYVFLPLPIEPENALQTEAQEWNSLVAFTDLLAKNVPAGWWVVVKEHPMASAPRTAGFWERIRHYPNVVVAAPREGGEAILTNARAVALINGTLGIQAAVSGKPVVTCYKDYVARLVPHVFVAQTPAALRDAFTKIRDGALPRLEDRLIAGRALELALSRTEFKVASDALLSDTLAKERQSDEDVERLVETLLASLNWPAAAAETRASRRPAPEGPSPELV